MQFSRLPDPEDELTSASAVAPSSAAPCVLSGAAGNEGGFPECSEQLPLDASDKDVSRLAPWTEEDPDSTESVCEIDSRRGSSETVQVSAADTFSSVQEELLRAIPSPEQEETLPGRATTRAARVDKTLSPILTPRGTVSSTLRGQARGSSMFPPPLAESDIDERAEAEAPARVLGHVRSSRRQRPSNSLTRADNYTFASSLEGVPPNLNSPPSAASFPAPASPRSSICGRLRAGGRLEEDESQSRERADEHGRPLASASDLRDAVERSAARARERSVSGGHTPLSARLPEVECRPVVKPHEDLAELNRKMVQEDVNGLSQKLQQLSRRVEEVEHNAYKFESSEQAKASRDRLWSDMVDMIETTQRVSRQNTETLGQRLEAVAKLLQTERSARQSQNQDLDRQLRYVQEGVEVDRRKMQVQVRTTADPFGLEAPEVRPNASATDSWRTSSSLTSRQQTPRDNTPSRMGSAVLQRDISYGGAVQHEISDGVQRESSDRDPLAGDGEDGIKSATLQENGTRGRVRTPPRETAGLGALARNQTADLQADNAKASGENGKSDSGARPWTSGFGASGYLDGLHPFDQAPLPPSRSARSSSPLHNRAAPAGMPALSSLEPSRSRSPPLTAHVVSKTSSVTVTPRGPASILTPRRTPVIATSAASISAFVSVNGGSSSSAAKPIKEESSPTHHSSSPAHQRPVQQEPQRRGLSPPRQGSSPSLSPLRQRPVVGATLATPYLLATYGVPPIISTIGLLQCSNSRPALGAARSPSPPSCVINRQASATGALCGDVTQLRRVPALHLAVGHIQARSLSPLRLVAATPINPSASTSALTPRQSVTPPRQSTPRAAMAATVQSIIAAPTISPRRQTLPAGTVDASRPVCGGSSAWIPSSTGSAALTPPMSAPLTPPRDVSLPEHRRFRTPADLHKKWSSTTGS